MNSVYTMIVSSGSFLIKNDICFVNIDYSLQFIHTCIISADKSNTLPYENKLPIFTELLTKYPTHSRFMKLVADAPTTTLQRLKGITTGSLPTFIDVGSNFATAEINEDNIIDQVVRSNLSAVFLGDATWTDLYPKRFLREHSYPSFNIYDLDTIDTAINQRFPSELVRDDWSLMVMHYLGVDHCGHKYGPLHPEMTRKLREMNQVIEKIVANMADDTMLLVIGDHGMTITGDHGGDTDDEVNSMLFAYSKKMEFVTNVDAGVMDQIDLTPTLAAILGVPIPFSNLGTINFDIVPDVLAPYLTNLQTQLMHTWQNVKQVHLYFYGYTVDTSNDQLPDQLLNEYLKRFQIFSLRVSNTLFNEGSIENFCQDVREHLAEIAVDCRKIWAQFDASYISQGLLFMAVITLFLFLITANLDADQFEAIFSYNHLSTVYTIVLGAPVAGFIVHLFGGMAYTVIDALHYFCFSSIGIAAFLLVQNWDLIATNWSTQRHFSNIVTRSVFIVSVSIFFSNSFVVEEQKVLCYLLTGALVAFLYKIRREYVWLAKLRKFRPELIFNASFAKLAVLTLAAVLVLRVSYSMHRCREEQGNCNETKSTAPVKWIDLLPILVLASFAAICRLFLRKCGNLTGFSIHVLISRYGIAVSAIACSLHFFATLAYNSKTVKGVYQIRVDAMAWVVWIVFGLQVATVCIKPLMLYIHQRTPQRTFSVPVFGSVIPQIVMRMKEMYEQTDESNANDDIPIVYGLATVYSSVLIAVSIGFVFVLALLLGPLAANGVFITLFVAVVLLVLNAIHRYQRCTKLGIYFQDSFFLYFYESIFIYCLFLQFAAFCLQPEVLALVSWHLLGHYSFYATAHQATLSQIDWHAAFVGRTAHYDHNNVISAILILINTFGGHFLIFVLYPLLVIAPNALYTLYPSLAPRRTEKIVIKNQNGTKQREIVKKITANIDSTGIKPNPNKASDNATDNLDIPHGELTLYENEKLFFSQLYKTGAQLIILQTIRVSKNRPPNLFRT